jgi:hypothetical protein
MVNKHGYTGNVACSILLWTAAVNAAHRPFSLVTAEAKICIEIII